MKKSKEITLVLITAALASCNRPAPDHQRGVYLRSDTTAPYGRPHHGAIGAGLLWYYAFRPYGMYNNGMGYGHAGYYSNAVGQRANVGRNGFKGGIMRGGFGGRAFSVSS